ncbi:Protein OS-9 [Pleurotus pulmonarius]|nr:Protein OS-9 [Pleurotus pulmonarius]
MRRCLLAVIYALPYAAARLLHSLPEDPAAFPKYRVAFLNALPVLNQTAEKWLRDGLRGGELEFLDSQWSEGDVSETYTSPKEIGSGDTHEEFHTSRQQPWGTPYSLEHMKIGPRDSYICFIPKPLEIPPSVDDEVDSDITTLRSWSLLQPLVGTCLYHRQGWFTYSYCHNKEIRQFKELIQAQPHVSGGYKPEEDPEWESYTLGRAPANPEPGADLTVTEQNALAANLELAKGAGSRYLVQKWSDGTFCDKTGKKREVEVQFHCSMTMTDTILFVKETKTCSYILVINTPRLCGEPGFRSPRDTRSEALIRCRAVVDSPQDFPAFDNKLAESDYPFKLPRQKPVLSAPPAEPKGTKGEAKDPKLSTEQVNEMVRRALQTFADNKAAGKTDEPNVHIESLGEDGGFVVEFLDEIPLDNINEADEHIDRIADILRAAGFNIKDTLISHKKDGQGAEDGGESKSKKKAGRGEAEPDPYRDEL